MIKWVRNRVKSIGLEVRKFSVDGVVYVGIFDYLVLDFEGVLKRVLFVRDY